MTDRPMKRARAQRVFVIQRVCDRMFCANVKNPVWVEDVVDADFVSQTRFRGIVRADWGRDVDDYRLVEVAPRLLELGNANEGTG